MNSVHWCAGGVVVEEKCNVAVVVVVVGDENNKHDVAVVVVVVEDEDNKHKVPVKEQVSDSYIFALLMLLYDSLLSAVIRETETQENGYNNKIHTQKKKGEWNGRVLFYSLERALTPKIRKLCLS